MKYTGEQVDGVPNGKGKQFFEQGITYSGEFVNGKRHGKGYFLDKSESMCYVECVDGRVAGL